MSTRRSSSFPADVIGDPVAIDLNVDAALLLQRLVGIDSYPLVLALMPNIASVEDRDRADIIVLRQLGEAGIFDGDIVHPAVEGWLRCLDRPDIEMDVRIVDTDAAGVPRRMLRMAMVRRRNEHVLAVRCDDHVVIQPVYQQGDQHDSIGAAFCAVLGEHPPARFESTTATAEQLAAIPAEQDERAAALIELGASQHAARVLSRGFHKVSRRCEAVMIEHHDGATTDPEHGLIVLDTDVGRVAVTPRAGVDGTVWLTYAPGDDATLYAGVRALVELLPGRNWFGTSRT